MANYPHNVPKTAGSLEYDFSLDCPNGNVVNFESNVTWLTVQKTGGLSGVVTLSWPAKTDLGSRTGIVTSRITKQTGGVVDCDTITIIQAGEDCSCNNLQDVSFIEISYSEIEEPTEIGSYTLTNNCQGTVTGEIVSYPNATLTFSGNKIIANHIPMNDSTESTKEYAVKVYYDGVFCNDYTIVQSVKPLIECSCQGLPYFIDGTSIDVPWHGTGDEYIVVATADTAIYNSRREVERICGSIQAFSTDDVAFDGDTPEERVIRTEIPDDNGDIHKYKFSVKVNDLGRNYTAPINFYFIDTEGNPTTCDFTYQVNLRDVEWCICERNMPNWGTEEKKINIYDGYGGYHYLFDMCVHSGFNVTVSVEEDNDGMFDGDPIYIKQIPGKPSYSLCYDDVYGYSGPSCSPKFYVIGNINFWKSVEEDSPEVDDTRTAKLRFDYYCDSTTTDITSTSQSHGTCIIRSDVNIDNATHCGTDIITVYQYPYVEKHCTCEKICTQSSMKEGKIGGFSYTPSQSHTELFYSTSNIPDECGTYETLRIYLLDPADGQYKKSVTVTNDYGLRYRFWLEENSNYYIMFEALDENDSGELQTSPEVKLVVYYDDEQEEPCICNGVYVTQNYDAPCQMTCANVSNYVDGVGDDEVYEDWDAYTYSKNYDYTRFDILPSPSMDYYNLKEKCKIYALKVDIVTPDAAWMDTTFPITGVSPTIKVKSTSKPVEAERSTTFKVTIIDKTTGEVVYKEDGVTPCYEKNYTIKEILPPFECLCSAYSSDISRHYGLDFTPETGGAGWPSSGVCHIECDGAENGLVISHLDLDIPSDVPSDCIKIEPEISAGDPGDTASITVENRTGGGYNFVATIPKNTTETVKTFVANLYVRCYRYSTRPNECFYTIVTIIQKPLNSD